MFSLFRSGNVRVQHICACAQNLLHRMLQKSNLELVLYTKVYKKLVMKLACTESDALYLCQCLMTH